MNEDWRQEKISEIRDKIRSIQEDNILIPEEVIKVMNHGEVYEDDEKNKIRSSFLGTCFALVPSGKYYMPWAYSNLDRCPQCDGKGVIPSPEHKELTCDICGGKRLYEAHLDELWWEKLQDELDVINAKYNRNIFHASGEGDPCDIFFQEVMDSPEEIEEEEVT